MIYVSLYIFICFVAVFFFYTCAYVHLCICRSHVGNPAVPDQDQGQVQEQELDQDTDPEKENEREQDKEEVTQLAATLFGWPGSHKASLLDLPRIFWRPLGSTSATRYPQSQLFPDF